MYYFGAFFSLKRNTASFLGRLQVDCNAFFVTLFLIGKTNQILRVYVCFFRPLPLGMDGVSSGKLAHHQLQGARKLFTCWWLGWTTHPTKYLRQGLHHGTPKASLGVKIAQQKILKPENHHHLVQDTPHLTSWPIPNKGDKLTCGKLDDPASGPEGTSIMAMAMCRPKKALTCADVEVWGVNSLKCWGWQRNGHLKSWALPTGILLKSSATKQFSW